MGVLSVASTPGATRPFVIHAYQPVLFLGSVIRPELSAATMKYFEMSSHRALRVGLLVLLGALPLRAAAQEFPLKALPLLTYVVDYEASWSPDGLRIVLISNRHG